ncbi:MAG: aldehyde ferredoxin oxidoreductase N-terminal domain-containing protein, partial [Bacteroidota bacterium]
MFGFFGRILKIDLTNKKAVITPCPKSVYKKYLGGKGLATYLLQKENPPGVDPLSPENNLIFATGPFCQSRLWGGSRYGVYTKSPLTGFYSESYSGGKVPEAVDAAGYDAIVVQGRSKEPVVVSVFPEGAHFFDAKELWGKDNFETEKEAVEKYALNSPGYKKGAVAIGPAGENMVKYAIISNDKWRCAGRTGAGAVMGSKNLKAVVFQGDQKRRLSDTDGVAAYSKDFSKTHIKSPAVAAYRERGTTMMVSLMNTIKAFPSRYWRQGTCDHWEKINGDTFHKKHEISPHACAKCFMSCGRMTKINAGAHKGLKLEGPEYETIYAFGGLCMIEDTDQIV